MKNVLLFIFIFLVLSTVDKNSASIPMKVLTFVPTAGQTVTIQNADGDILVILSPAGLLATLTFAFPSAPYDGQRIHVFCTQTITALTMTAASTVVNTLTGVLGNGCGTFAYSAANNKWYRIAN